MLIQVLSLIATTLMFGFLIALVIVGARSEPAPKPEPFSDAELAVMRCGKLLTRLMRDDGPEGRVVRSAGENVGAEAIGEAISSISPAVIAQMTDEQLRRHIVRSCRYLLAGSPYRVSVH